ncbi:hypothetical protein EJ08DRAFT_580643 [Tothia fuscella]|uniref:Xylanolytic transcriptional activator regulatory domain-containing protein n=1 Tax=Tothia fuscella TaxID=1048955 RepID=A0A9P4U3U5_9PEZI|nr:hypothetical protein EJ08DRAFT_580643 [Tothia fuscella]
MKCDGQKPRCSNCVTYEVDCTYTAPSRTSAPKKRRSHGKATAVIHDLKISNRVTDTHGRLGWLEYLVQQLTERLDVVEKRNEVEPVFQQENASERTIATPLENSTIRDDNNTSKALLLPPQEHVLPVIQTYLREFNTVLPLFHADTLLRLVHDCYSVEPLQRDLIEWAAIYVVLALAWRYNLVSSHSIPSATTCLNRAESVLQTVVLGDTHLLNIQVLVGMVMLLQDAQDPKPALVLIATTIRLAHGISLHNQTCSAHLDPHHARQRAYVFWLAYILDKDLSMRSKQPSIQLDDDINLDMPSPTVLQKIENENIMKNNDSGMGVITTADGTIKINYLTARVGLAAVQGGVYDYIYSTRSQKRSPEERSQALQSVAFALEQWKASVPPEFSASASSRRVAPGMLHFLATLHSTSLACTSLINQAHAWDVEWIASIRRYGTQGIVPVLPPRWEILVCEARHLLVLFKASGERDRWNFWTTGCSYMTSMVLLTANSMHKPIHSDLSLDKYLVEVGLRTVDKIAKDTGSEMLQSFQETCTELHERTQQKRAEAAGIANSVESSSYFVNLQHSLEGNNPHIEF